jgi:predicted Rossmann-fold nucleotide-binding protein
LRRRPGRDARCLPWSPQGWGSHRRYPARHSALETPPNEFVEFAVYSGLGYARNSLVALSGEAVIAIDGAYGTLSELAFALVWEVPVIGLQTWEFSYPGFDQSLIRRADTPEQAVEFALAAAAKRRRLVDV